MTPIDKANELVNKFLNTDIFVMTSKYDQQVPIECALITVDEMIEETRIFCDDKCIERRMIYWKEVKKELEVMK